MKISVEAFKKVDIILGPTTPTPAFKIGEKTNDPISMYLSDIYTIAMNLAGLPGLSIPMGFVNDLPVGLQLIGNYFEESLLLNVAHQYQQHTNWHHNQMLTIIILRVSGTDPHKPRHCFGPIVNK